MHSESTKSGRGEHLFKHADTIERKEGHEKSGKYNTSKGN